MSPETPKPAEPRVAAVVDIGTNSLRMLVAQIGDDGRAEVLEELQRPVRLGHDTFAIGRLRRQTMNAAIAVLRDFRKTIETYGVRNVTAVATSAVREAANAELFTDRVASAADMRVEIIEPAEEGRLTVSAVRQAVGRSFGLDKRKVLVVEVGGGSTMLTVMDAGRIAASGSYPLGAVRMQELLSTSRERPEQAAALLRGEVATAVAAIRRSMTVSGMDMYVAVGWDARFVAKHAGRAAERDGLQAVTARNLERFIDRCAGLAPDRLSMAYGLPFANAETLLPALLVNQALLAASGADRMMVAGVSMRDGLLIDLADRLAGREDPVLAESVLQSARTIGEKYRCDAAHAELVAELSMRLFDELAREHGLAARQRLLLQAAALLHEIGSFVGSRAHHKHSHYLIVNSEIFGLRQWEREIVALVARYHRRATPRSTHEEYRSLPRTPRLVVNRLAALLRVADALAGGQGQQMLRFRAERRDDDLVLAVPGVADFSAEERALAVKTDLFEDVFGMKIRLETAESGG